MAAAAGVVAVIQPGRLCIGATLAAGFATDVFICMPAAQEYESKVGPSYSASLLAEALLFLPWLKKTMMYSMLSGGKMLLGNPTF